MSNAFYGQGSGPIQLDDVACTGTETNVLLCRYDPVTSDCGHIEDAGVQCQVDSKFKIIMTSKISITYLHYRAVATGTVRGVVT